MSTIQLTDTWLDIWDDSALQACSIIKINPNELQTLSDDLDKQWANNNNFTAKAGEHLFIYNKSGQLQKVLFGEDAKNKLALCELIDKLPEGVYQVKDLTEAEAIGWVLHQYKFNKYKTFTNKPIRLCFPQQLNRERCRAIASAVLWGRELINLPAEDLTPAQLALEAKDLASLYSAKIDIIADQKRIENEFPAVYAVGKAAKAESRLIDMSWGNESDFAITLVGKGVCFDTGGLNLKPTSGMATMKKDMGGAAHVLALAKMIMSLEVPIKLRVIIPAVENSISGQAYRPGDIVTTRNGTTVEITNTDAEGRMILADALSYAQEQPVDWIIDIATLTGAARVALGTDLPGFFSNEQQVIDLLMLSGAEADDPIWPLPLYHDYKKLTVSPIADLKNAASGGYGGAITAALFLEHFVQNDQPWAHFDLMAENVKAKAGRPLGGEIMGMQAVLLAITKVLNDRQLISKKIEQGAAVS